MKSESDSAKPGETSGKEKGFFGRLYEDVTRKKKVGYDSDHIPPGTRGFGRELVDITATGVSNTIGSALYILTGFVMRYKAGPAILVSYLIASVTTFCSALTYSELVGQISAHGSDYLYSYVTMGELYGFLVGWNLILEYCVDVASVSKALTIHIDVVFFDSMIMQWQEATIGIPKSYSFSDSVDFFGVSFCLILTLIVAMGWKFSPVVNNFFTCFNLVCFVSIIVFGSFVADTSYWYEAPGPLNETMCSSKHYNINNMSSAHKASQIGENAVGFAPAGIHGAIKGAGSCIFAFAGFRAILTDGVKTKNPKRNLPLAAILTLAIATILYTGVTFTISCMIPYWKIDTEAPITSTFCEHGLKPLKNMLAIGAISGLVQASVYKFLPLPPLLTIMSDDGLLFKFLGEVDKETRGPFKGTVSYGIVIMVFVAFFFLEELIDMLSIGTLIAYMMASVAVIRLRYRPLPHYTLYSKVSNKSEEKVKIALAVYIVTVLTFGLIVAYQNPNTILFIVLTSALSIIIITCGSIIYIQPQYINTVPFNCPCVPIMPLFSIFVNGLLMMHLSYQTWIRFIIWMSLGLIVYFSYSIKNSVLSESNSSRQGGGNRGPYSRQASNKSQQQLPQQNSEPMSRRHHRVSRRSHLVAPDNRTRSRSTPGRATEADERAARLFEWTAQLRAMNTAAAAPPSEGDITMATKSPEDVGEGIDNEPSGSDRNEVALEIPGTP